MTLAVSTGLDSFSNPQDIGALYPFEGAEWLFVALAVLLWLAWTFLQNKGETNEERDAVEYYERIGLDRAMLHGGSALIATDEEWAEELRRRAAAEGPPPAPSSH